MSCAFGEPVGQVQVCGACGLGRTVTHVAAIDAQDYGHRDPQRDAYFEQICTSLLAGAKRGRALDVGCGSGAFVDVLERHGWSATGIDSFANSPADARLIRTSLETYAGDAQLDLITMVHSLEHFDRPDLALSKARELLAPGGSLLVVVPNFGGVWSRSAGDDWHMLNTAEHRYHFTIAALVQMFAQNGLPLVRLETHSDYAPSLLQVELMARRFYDRGIAKHLPTRPLVFRAATAQGLRTRLNAIADRLLVGAEIRAVVQAPPV